MSAHERSRRCAEGVARGTCSGCGASWFPRRLICPGCGRRSWVQTVVRGGVVEEVTTVRRRVGDHAGAEAAVLSTVALPDGQRLVAGLDQALERGTPVLLCQHDGAVRARPVPR